MSEYVGRTGALRLYSYPESRRTAQIGPFARNFAIGPALQTAVTTGGTLVPWAAIESGAPPGTDVPITPKVTGVLVISGVITLKNASGAPVTVQLRVEINGVPLLAPLLEEATVDASGFEAVPFMTEPVFLLVVGTTVNIQILLTPTDDDAISIAIESSSLSIQEVPVATG